MKVEKKSSVSASAKTGPSDIELNNMVEQDAVNYIRSAISSLGGLFRRTNDPKYKDAIANLSVILLDIQN